MYGKLWDPTDLKGAVDSFEVLRDALARAAMRTKGDRSKYIRQLSHLVAAGHLIGASVVDPVEEACDEYLAAHIDVGVGNTGLKVVYGENIPFRRAEAMIVSQLDGEVLWPQMTQFLRLEQGTNWNDLSNGAYDRVIALLYAQVRKLVENPVSLEQGKCSLANRTLWQMSEVLSGMRFITVNAKRNLPLTTQNDDLAYCLNQATDGTRVRVELAVSPV